MSAQTYGKTQITLNYHFFFIPLFKKAYDLSYDVSINDHEDDAREFVIIIRIHLKKKKNHIISYGFYYIFIYIK